jgi:hypothetical protein
LLYTRLASHEEQKDSRSRCDWTSRMHPLLCITEQSFELWRFVAFLLLIIA